MDSPHIKSSCGTQNKISNPMGIGLGIDYVTWRKILKWIPPTSKENPKMDPPHQIFMWDTRKILKWIPPTSNLHVGHKIKFPILWV